LDQNLSRKIVHLTNVFFNNIGQRRNLKIALLRSDLSSVVGAGIVKSKGVVSIDEMNSAIRTRAAK